MNSMQDGTAQLRSLWRRCSSIILTWVGILGTGALIIWSFAGLAYDLTHVRNGLGSVKVYLSELVPQSREDWNYDCSLGPDLVAPLVATVQMAVVGTVLGAITAFPVSFFAARTDLFPRPISNIIKSALNIARSVPTMICALIVVGAIGLGEAAGAVTLAFVTFVSLSKLFAEALETVNPGPIEAVKAVGGNSVNFFVYGMMPQVFPVYISTTLYSLETNLQSSFIIGIVGAGGMGYELINDIHYYRLLDVGTIVFIMIVVVNAVDYTSYRLRSLFA